MNRVCTTGPTGANQGQPIPSSSTHFLNMRLKMARILVVCELHIYHWTIVTVWCMDAPPFYFFEIFGKTNKQFYRALRTHLKLKILLVFCFFFLFLFFFPICFDLYLFFGFSDNHSGRLWLKTTDHPQDCPPAILSRSVITIVHLYVYVLFNAWCGLWAYQWISLMTIVNGSRYGPTF